MARLLGIMLPDKAKVDYALTLFYGVGWNNARVIMKSVGIDHTKRVKDLHEDDLKKLADVIDKNYTVEGDLRQQLNDNLKRLKEIGAYRGIRHIRGLPARGQRTKSNARTKRGKRKTVGALTKEAWAKMEQVQTQAQTASKPKA